MVLCGGDDVKKVLSNNSKLGSNFYFLFAYYQGLLGSLLLLLLSLRVSTLS